MEETSAAEHTCSQCIQQTGKAADDPPHVHLRVLDFRVVDRLEGRSREVIYKCAVCGVRFKLTTAAGTTASWRLA